MHHTFLKIKMEFEGVVLGSAYHATTLAAAHVCLGREASTHHSFVKYVAFISFSSLVYHYITMDECCEEHICAGNCDPIAHSTSVSSMLLF